MLAIHRFRVAHDRTEIHVREDVALHVDARRDLHQFHAFGGAAEDAALGHVEHRLTGLGGIKPAEGDLFDAPR